MFAGAILGGVHPLAAAAAVLVALISIPIATLIFRMQGAYFAIGTWFIAEVFRLSFAQISTLGGGSGSSLPVHIVKSIAATRYGREAVSCWFALGAVITIVAVIYWFLRSRRGLALTSIRDNHLAAATLGINIWRTKLEVYVVTAALTAVVKTLILLQKLRISPDAAFSANDWTAFVILTVIIGGIGTIVGPTVGKLLFFVRRETLAGFGTSHLLVLGTVAIVVMLKVPKGLWEMVRERFDLQLLPLHCRVTADRAEKGV